MTDLHAGVLARSDELFARAMASGLRRASALKAESFERALEEVDARHAGQEVPGAPHGPGYRGAAEPGESWCGIGNRRHARAPDRREGVAWRKALPCP